MKLKRDITRLWKMSRRLVKSESTYQLKIDRSTRSVRDWQIEDEGYEEAKGIEAAE
jgi:hypothetical protein